MRSGCQTTQPNTISHQQTLTQTVGDIQRHTKCCLTSKLNNIHTIMLDLEKYIFVAEYCETF